MFSIYSLSITSVFHDTVFGIKTTEDTDLVKAAATYMHENYVTTFIATTTTTTSASTPTHSSSTKHTSNLNQKSKQESTTKVTHGKCGLILFYHINQCAGGSLGNWFETYASGYHLLQDIYSYLRVFNESTLQYSWQRMAQRGTAFVKKVSPKTGWRVLELHHGFPGVHYSQKHINRWKEIVESKGCVFHKTTMLRDPLERFVSNVNKNNPPLNEMESFMNSRKNWLGRYFLFGLCGYYKDKLGCGFDPKSNFTITPNMNESYLAEAIDIMSKFDSIGFTDRFSEYLSHMISITGWKVENKRQKNIASVHKSHQIFNVTQSIIKTFLESNKEDYLLYYTMKHKIKKVS